MILEALVWATQRKAAGAAASGVAQKNAWLQPAEIATSSTEMRPP